jgi:hypothetical protein
MIEVEAARGSSKEGEAMETGRGALNQRMGSR